MGSRAVVWVVRPELDERELVEPDALEVGSDSLEFRGVADDRDGPAGRLPRLPLAEADALPLELRAEPLLAFALLELGDELGLEGLVLALLLRFSAVGVPVA